MTRSKLILALAAGTMFCMPASGQNEDPVQPDENGGYVSVATLGISTRAPSKQETVDLGLKMEVRVRGQIVTKLAADGVAAAAGIKVGDVLIQLDRNEIFSQDDIADFLRVAKPGQEVDVLLQSKELQSKELQSKKSPRAEPIRLSLGSERVPAPFLAELEWQYASLGQLPDAFAEAKKKDQVVLLGISGAET